LKTDHGCHTCNRTDQQPQVTSTAVRFLQIPLMKLKFSRVGQVNMSKHHQLRSRHDPLFLTKVMYTPLEGASGGKKAMKLHIQHDGFGPRSVYLLYFAEIITLFVMKAKRYYYGHLDRTDDVPSPTLTSLRPKRLCFL
jgi:hypothetical protein